MADNCEQDNNTTFLPCFLWLDNCITEPPPKYTDIIKPFSWSFFANDDACIEYIRENKDKKICFITSGIYGSSVVPLIHELVQVESIFIYCMNVRKHQNWSRSFSKVHGVYCDQAELLVSLSKDIADFHIQLGDTCYQRNNEKAPRYDYSKALDILQTSNDTLSFDHDTLLLLTDFKSKLNRFSMEIIPQQIIASYQEAVIDVPIIQNQSILLNKRAAELEKLPSNKEDITIVWLDKYINDAIEHTKILLNKINDYVQVYRDPYQCLSDIESKQEKIFLIITGSYAENFLTDFHIKPQIDSIFIYCAKREKYTNLLQKYNKIIGCFDLEQELIKSVHQTTELKSYANFSLLDNNNQQQHFLTRQSALFLWNQLLPVVLNEIKNELTVQQLLNLCEVYYSNNSRELKNIKDFYENYCCSKAIIWYTKDSFVHKVLNKALRTHDHEKLNAFRFYIQDLRAQLYESYQILKKSEHSIRVYRGLCLSSEELNKLKTNIGGLISSTGFLSTSRDRTVALMYSGQSSNKSHIENVLFDIYCDTTTSSTIFVDISKYSSFPEEQEVLFDLGSVFEIYSVERDLSSNCWTVKLRTENRSVEIVNNLIKTAKKEMNQDNLLLLFAKLMLYLNEYSKTEDYFKQISNTIPEKHTDIARIYSNMASIHQISGKCNEALQSYKRALEMQLYQPEIASTYCDIGDVYRSSGNYSNALVHLAKALEIQSNCLPLDHPDIQKTLYYIGDVKHKIGKVMIV
ncbi:unnamed protein product [Didymodactylos carnosus]|uniref:NAD(P)(+)--arginine ADP-ribosyltransferase n=1 Tax=Didymodactylos carnosus TaxID=1234261 RepID=A0A814WKY9_9BILA|nr:unnamed protein product [Didymodactylos carnosus]CAF1203663.1 unnamed protein product [Didymodactylos carnosus]CAF3842129.1 unnamed protein product [Didymodactylos carnosus]CAF3968017.1 unnamed protein product [Didymodactylos carnosus]